MRVITEFVFNLCVVAAIALPLLFYFALGSYYKSVAAEGKLASWEQRQRDVEAYGAQLKRYRAFAGKVRSFAASAEQNNIGPAHWNSHRLEIEKRKVTFRELGRLLSDTSGGSSQFFVPEKLEMKAVRTNPPDGVILSLVGEFLVKIK